MTTIRETTFNTALAEILRRKNPQWRMDDVLIAEGGRVLQGSGTPDILIAPSNAMPIVVETEFAPAATVEQDAIDRLGRKIANDRTIEQVVALRAPLTVKKAAAVRLDTVIRESKFEYCLFTASENDQLPPARWPLEGWLNGGVDDLVALIENTGIFEQLIAESLDTLEAVVAGTASTLINRTKKKPDVQKTIAKFLHQSNNAQTMRMAMAILANALTFQEILAGMEGIKTLRYLREQGTLPAPAVAKEWKRILDEINYHPIFSIAYQIIDAIPTDIASDILGQLSEVVEKLVAFGITSSHDLYGRMFQRLITDRKFLATFYTLPESAMLLAEIAVEMMGVDFTNKDTAPKLRIADFACGTGTLLSAAYHTVLARHRRAGHDDAEIHKAMMEESLVATDIMPAGVHLTSSILSSAHPTITFKDAAVQVLPYGIEDDNQFYLGALDLLEREAMHDLFQISTRIGGHGEQKTRTADDTQKMFALEHASFDLVIMNPPFTRPTNHEIADQPVPAFAGLGKEKHEQKSMATRLQKINQGLREHAGHGNAGLASNFIDLAHQKLKAGGVLALVLPSTFAQGESWQKSRNLVNKHYDDIFIISLAVSGSKKRSFSADTGMAEILLIGKKREQPRKNSAAQIRYVSLCKRPTSAMQSVVMMRAICNSANGIFVGKDYLGEVMPGLMSHGGSVGALSYEVVAIVKELQSGCLISLRRKEKRPLPITVLGEIAERQLLHRDINGIQPNGKPRGPFDIETGQDKTSTYPCLWAHDFEREKNFIVLPDSHGRVRSNMQDEANDVWKTATTLHFNLDFQVNAQSIAACTTPKPTLGGVAWPNVRPMNPKHEPAIVLWANCTLGLLLWWWVASRQQKGRARLTISQLPDLPILDTRKLTAAQHKTAARIFDKFKTKNFRAANEAYHCESRIALDRAVLIDLLGMPETILEPLNLLRDKWCNEPSVHGGKSTRPQTTP